MNEIAKLRTLDSYGRSVEQIRDELARRGQDDPEAAHVAEDQIARAALEAIRDGHPDPAALAREVLVVLDADYPRWFA